MQLNKSEVLFHVVSLAALLHTLYIALFLPAMSFIFNFCGIKKKGEKKTYWPESEHFTPALEN